MPEAELFQIGWGGEFNLALFVVVKIQDEGKGLLRKKCCDLFFETPKCSVNEKSYVRERKTEQTRNWSFWGQLRLTAVVGRELEDLDGVNWHRQSTLLKLGERAQKTQILQNGTELLRLAKVYSGASPKG